METVTETITPAMATKYLEMNTHNRPVRQSYVEFLAKEIKNDRWLQNGATIVLNDDVLVDGQHRLWAVITANRPIITLVTRGVDKNCYPTIDTGIGRTAGDVLSIGGEQHTNPLATAARFIMHYQSKHFIHRDKISNGSIFEFVQNNSGLKDSLSFILSLSNQAKILPCSSGAALHYLMGKKDKDLADGLFTFLYAGVASDSCDTFIALREKLIGCSKATARTRANILAIYIIKAWNARRKGTHMRVFKFFDGEEVPKIK